MNKQSKSCSQHAQQDHSIMLRLIRAPEHTHIELVRLKTCKDSEDALLDLQFEPGRGLGQHAALPLASCFGSNTHMDQQLHVQFHSLLGEFDGHWMPLHNKHSGPAMLCAVLRHACKRMCATAAAAVVPSPTSNIPPAISCCDAC